MVCSGPNSNECSRCATNFYLHEGACLDTCPDGFWNDDNTGASPVSPRCSQCNSNCLVCSKTDPDLCTACRNNTYLEAGVC